MGKNDEIVGMTLFYERYPVKELMGNDFIVLYLFCLVNFGENCKPQTKSKKLRSLLCMSTCGESCC